MIRRLWWRFLIRCAGRGLDMLNRYMVKKNVPGWKRDQFWREFLKSPKARAEIAKTFRGW